MAIHWQVKFCSLRAETLYTVNIYDDSYTGDPVQLTGAAQPFSTEEDGSDDLFMPVRTQSGYLRIVDTGKDNDGNAFDWREFIPTNDVDRPVTLTDEQDNVMWAGFMQAQNFGGKLYELPQEREFPLQCPLTVTSRQDVNYQQTTIRNFAYLLQTIVGSIPEECRPTRFVVQGGSDARDWLLKKIDWQNFCEQNSDDSLMPRFNLYQALEELCRFWGWTARIDGLTLYLAMADDVSFTTFLEFDGNGLQDLSIGLPSGDDDGAFISTDLIGDIYASASNSDTQRRGPSKMVVTANANVIDSSIIEAFPYSVNRRMFDGSSYVETYGDLRGIFTEDITFFVSPYLTGGCASGASFNVMRITEQALAIDGTDYETIRIKPTYDGSALASLDGLFEHCFIDQPISGFSSGGLYIYGDIYRQGKRYVYAQSNGVGKSHIYIRVGIGKNRSNALWWNGTAWSSTQSAFTVRVGDEERHDLMAHINTSDSGLVGRLFVDILGSDDMEHQTSGGYIDRFDLTGFRVEFRRSTHTGISSVFDTFERGDSHEYKAESNDMVEDEWSISTVFASENDMDFGVGILLNSDGTICKGYDYTGGGTLTHPEQHLADRVAAYWATSRRMLDCDLRADLIGQLTPQHVSTIDGTQVYPYSISHEWRDDSMHVLFQEIETL